MYFKKHKSNLHLIQKTQPFFLDIALYHLTRKGYAMIHGTNADCKNIRTGKNACVDRMQCNNAHWAPFTSSNFACYGIMK